MAELIRDTAFGHLVRLLTHNKYLRYQEEINPELWKKYVNEDKSANAAHHGTIAPPEDDESIHGVGGVRTREDGITEPVDSRTGKDGDRRASSSSSSGTRFGEKGTYNEASGAKIDKEKGRDLNVIDWEGDNDPEVRQAHAFSRP